MSETAAPYLTETVSPSTYQGELAMRYLAVVERIIFEQLGGLERCFGREQVLKIVIALVKKYPIA